MNGFEVTHPWNRTADTVLLVYNMSMDTKIFTFGLPGQCVEDRQVQHIFESNAILIFKVGFDLLNSWSF